MNEPESKFETAVLSCSWRCARDGRTLSTKTGTQMAGAFGFCILPGERDLPLAVIGFKDQAAPVAATECGRLYRVRGELRADDFNGRDRYELIAQELTEIGENAAAPDLTI